MAGDTGADAGVDAAIQADRAAARVAAPWLGFLLLLELCWWLLPSAPFSVTP
ncbi:MAG: hypothetical protein N2C14_14805 [Planctomycetales bacterium]